VARVLLVIGARSRSRSSPRAGEAETYRWVDDQGNVTYSNRPPQQRENADADAGAASPHPR
jgi:hypothetical protein